MPPPHYWDMDCERAREAISARIDGEDPGVAGDEIDAHLAGCAACREWQQRAHAVTRRARLGGFSPARDLTGAILAAAAGRAPAAGRRRRILLRAGLVAVAVAQLAITVPLLVLGHDHDAGRHAAHELGSFDLALVIAFVVGAARPALSAGLAWPCAVAAAGLAGTAVADLISGQAVGADEAQHLVAVAGAALLFWQARTASAGNAPAPARAWPAPERGPAAAGGEPAAAGGEPAAPGQNGKAVA